MRSRPTLFSLLPATARAVLGAALIGLAPGLALAQGVQLGPVDTASAAGVIRVDLAGQSAGAQNLSIPRGKSAIVQLPVDARDVLVTNPAVADVVLRSPRVIYIVGTTAGQTDAAFFDAAGRRILGLNIRVDQDFSALGQTINTVIPGAQVRIEPVNNSVILLGQVDSTSDADKAVQIAQQFTAKPEQVVNMLSITGKQQVMLKVRIVEVQRSIVKQLGFNMSAVIGRLGSSQLEYQMAPTYGVNGALLGGAAAGYLLDTTKGGTVAGSNGVNQAQSTIEAFEQVGLVRTLAEPTLTAVSGEAAKFLAGGEYPVPTGEDTTGRVTITFKPYGVGLGFTPVVLSNGRISLKVSTEVSELTSVGAISLDVATTGSSSSSTSSSSSSSGGTVTSITIPGLNVRRAETTVELPSGGAMMIAGLLKEEAKQDISSLPGLMNLPVLGALFRSRDYQDGETELVVIVTPYLVKATSPGNLQTPADGMELANDAQTVLLGRLNKVYKAPPEAVAGRTYQGPVGYVIE